LLVGTGHAGSFLFAQRALHAGLPATEIDRAIRRHGRPGGDPIELLDVPGLPYVGGELGPALGVGQGLAAARPGLRVVTVIGDGECETPVALAALAHRDALPPAPDAVWLPVVNVNGARMGSSARFTPDRLRGLLEGMGYTVLHSGPHADDAAAAAGTAWELAEGRVPVVWLSVTDKGWPAPERLGGRPFRGHLAHKPTGLDLADPGLVTEITSWLQRLNDPPVVATDGTVDPDVCALAARIRTDLGSPDPWPAGRVGAQAGRSATAVSAEVGRERGPTASDRSPMVEVDRVLAERAIRVLSPDEGSSNRLDRCLAAGMVTEVLAEELCSSWAWGYTEGGVPAVLVSYEAFAPLVATQLVQYLKLLGTRPPAGRPPLAVVLTSLGWGNSPTHQNTDLVASLLARARDRPVRVVFPVGARSARRRLQEVLDDRDTLVVLTCSKQPLLDVADPGGAAVGIRAAGVPDDDAVIVAVGDVAVTEAVAALSLAALQDVRVGVVAIVEPGRLDDHPDGPLRRACRDDLPAVCVSWIAADHLARTYQRVRPVPTAHLGYRERWGPTPWETLEANGLTRWSLLRALRDAGCPLDPDRGRTAGPPARLTTRWEVRAL